MEHAAAVGDRGPALVPWPSGWPLVAQVVPALMGAFVADYVMLGGGNSKEIRPLPPGARMGHNLTAFRGGYRLWHLDDVHTLDAAGDLPGGQQRPSEWRLV